MKRMHVPGIKHTISKQSLTAPVSAQYRSKHDQFKAMLYWGDKDGTKFPAEKTIRLWWGIAFPFRPLPDGHTVNDLQLAIQYELMMKGYKNEGIVPNDTFCRNYKAATSFDRRHLTHRLQSIMRCQDLGEMGKQIINPLPSTEEEEMAVRKRSRGVPEDNKKASTPEERKPNKGSVRFTICDLISQEKYTDEEIIKKIADKLQKTVSKSAVAGDRRAINAGNREKLGFAKPKQAIPEYVREGRSLIPVDKAKNPSSSAKKDTKNPSNKRERKQPEPEPPQDAQPSERRVARRVRRGS